MAEQFLHYPDVVAALKQMARERVAKFMAVHWLSKNKT